MESDLYLSYIALGAPEVTSSAAFYNRVLGLSVLDSSPDEGLRLGWESGQQVLELLPGEGLDHFALEVRDQAGLERIETRLDRHGVKYKWVSWPGSHQPTLSFRDPTGHLVKLHGPVDRSGERSSAGLRPTRIHHVTLTAESVPDLVDFYVSVLGFAVSDWMGDVFAWLRCNRDHHTVAIVQGDPEDGLDHYAFEIESWASLKDWCDELANRDVGVSWGPGRHGPGNNIFIMFDDLDGYRIELSCEMERYWDDRAAHTPRQWVVGPQTVNLWGGGQPSWRGGTTLDGHEPRRDTGSPAATRTGGA